MSKKLKKYLPQTTAGLIRYYEEEISHIRVHPTYVIGGAIALMIIVLVLHHYLYAPLY